MYIECVPATRVVESDWRAWDAIRSQAPALSSPYFSSTFCRIVSESSSDLFVGRISDDRGLAGFFPFHRSRWATGWPLAKGLSGYQGLIARQDASIDAVELLKCCRLRTFDFAQLPATQASFVPFSYGKDASHTMDLRAGFDDYAARIRRSSRIIAATRGREQRLEREVGRVRFEFHLDDFSMFQTLVRLKTSQYRRSGAHDIFMDPWTLDILRAVFRTQSPQLSGVLSALFVGDHVAALLFSIRSHGVLHCWLAAYDPQFGRHSPGIILLVKLARRAATLGIELVDLGTGTHAYKTRLATGGVNVLWGRVERPSFAAVWRAARRNVRRLGRYLRP
jgi:CelD/BcsL family acetyltransferase involved in cellulose biosynthesis